MDLDWRKLDTELVTVKWDVEIVEGDGLWGWLDYLLPLGTVGSNEGVVGSHSDDFRWMDIKYNKYFIVCNICLRLLI